MKAIKILTALVIIATSKLYAKSSTSDYIFELRQIKTRSKCELIVDNSILNIDTNKIFPEIGFIAGSHFENTNQNGPNNFNQGLVLEVFAKYNISGDIHSTIAFTYWKSKTNEVNTTISKVPSETIDSKGLKMGLDFSLFRFSNIILSVGPSISIENTTKAQSAVFGFGVDVKLLLPIWNDKIDFLSTFQYRNGSELLNYGGGFNYSFISYLAGIEISIGN